MTKKILTWQANRLANSLTSSEKMLKDGGFVKNKEVDVFLSINGYFKEKYKISSISTDDDGITINGEMI